MFGHMYQNMHSVMYQNITDNFIAVSFERHCVVFEIMCDDPKISQAIRLPLEYDMYIIWR